MPIPGIALAGGVAGQSARVTISNDDISSTEVTSIDASLTLLANGTIVGDGNVQSFSGNWIEPPAAGGAAYEVRAHVSSGDTPSGSLDAWLSLGSTRSWTLSQMIAGTTTCDLLIEIRSAASGTVLDSATYSITATVVV
jgi:hypothetical protein